MHRLRRLYASTTASWPVGLLSQTSVFALRCMISCCCAAPMTGWNAALAISVMIPIITEIGREVCTSFLDPGYAASPYPCTRVRKMYAATLEVCPSRPTSPEAVVGAHNGQRPCAQILLYKINRAAGCERGVPPIGSSQAPSTLARPEILRGFPLKTKRVGIALEHFGVDFHVVLAE